MLRTANLHLFHIGIHRFSTIGHPKALDACYGAHWRLLRPNFHWQAVDSLQNTRLSPVRTYAHRAHQIEKAFHINPKCSLLCPLILIQNYTLSENLLNSLLNSLIIFQTSQQLIFFINVIEFQPSYFYVII